MINWTEIDNKITNANRIVITTHIHPDGDGLGSSVTMIHHLLEAGKDCRIYIASELPSEYTFLNKGGHIYRYESSTDEAWISKADLALIFDVGDYMRMKLVGDVLTANEIPMINIDHHPIQNELSLIHI